MLRKIFVLVLILLLSGMVFAGCEGGKVDINSASASELDKIIWVGPATAEKIIGARPFESVDGLLNVNGIGEVKLQEIKDQGIACVGNSNEEEVQEEDIPPKEEFQSEENDQETSVVTPSEEEEEIKSSELITLQTINLNPQDIKSEESSKSLGRNYAFYGLIGFSVVLGLLFGFRVLRKKKYENEFR